jgi:hypothetical protein
LNQFKNRARRALPAQNDPAIEGWRFGDKRGVFDAIVSRPASGFEAILGTENMVPSPAAAALDDAIHATPVAEAV